uniref:Mitochondrial import inner membrane translocase subunit n=2 Tax=Panagrolaimus TaxID=55784 RepID=A0A914NY77_9BILA
MRNAIEREHALKVQSDLQQFIFIGVAIEAGIIDMESSDPNFNRFLHQLQAESQRQKFAEQVHTLTNRCWDVCFTDYRPPSKLDSKTQTCLSNCVNRMVDASNFMVEHLQKMDKSNLV